jgi:folate-binding protein YgfZ
LSTFLAAPSWPALRVYGPDAATWLNGIVTCDVLSVRPGRAVWGSLLTKQGKIQADLQIVGRSEELIVFLSGGDAVEILSTLDGYLVMEDAEIEQSPAQAILAVGASPRALLESLGFQSSQLPWGVEAGPHVVAVSPEQWSALQKQSEVAELLVGAEQWGAYLTSSGLPRFGVDYTSSDNPHAASLERRTVDWSKGCYLGQEVVCMQDMRGKVKRRLVRLRASGAVLLTSGHDVVHESAVVGRVTSSAGTVALASIQAPYFEPGTKLLVGATPVEVESLL